MFIDFCLFPFLACITWIELWHVSFLGILMVASHCWLQQSYKMLALVGCVAHHASMNCNWCLHYHIFSMKLVMVPQIMHPAAGLGWLLSSTLAQRYDPTLQFPDTKYMVKFKDFLRFYLHVHYTNLVLLDVLYIPFGMARKGLRYAAQTCAGINPA